MKVSWGKLGLRTLAALAVTGTLYFLIFVVPSFFRQDTLPDQPLHALRAALNEHLLVVSSIESFKDTGPAASVSLSELGSRLQASRTAVEDLLKKNEEVLGSDTVNQTKAFLEAQAPHIDEYTDRFNSFSKPIAYNPADNLGLEIASNKDELSGRASAADTALAGIAQSGGLSGAAVRAFQDSSSCFKQLSTNFKTGSFSSVTAQRQQCTKEYETVRKEAIQYVLGAFKNDGAKQSIKDGSDIVRQLDQRIQNP